MTFKDERVLSSCPIPSRQEYARTVNTREELLDAINAAVLAGATGTATLNAALYRGEICHRQLFPGGSTSAVKRFTRAVGNRPSVLLIGDDDGMDRGPPGWPGAAKTLAWGRWFLIHAAGAERWHYELAIAAAQVQRRVVVIECSTATLPAWQAMVAKAKAPHRVGGLTVYPREGVHPLPISRGALQ